MVKSECMTAFRISGEVCLPQAQPHIKTGLSHDSPALDVMTDLATVKAETIHPRTTLAEAEEVMIRRGVRSLMVSEESPCVEGLITAADLLGERPIQVERALRLTRASLRVEHLMTPLHELDFIDYDEVKESRVEHVLETFRCLKNSHLVVVQKARAEGPARIRGVISSTQVARQLQSNGA